MKAVGFDRPSIAKRKLVEGLGIALLLIGVAALGAGVLMAVVGTTYGAVAVPGSLTGLLPIKWGWYFLMHPENPWVRDEGW